MGWFAVKTSAAEISENFNAKIRRANDLPTNFRAAKYYETVGVINPHNVEAIRLFGIWRKQGHQVLRPKLYGKVRTLKYMRILFIL